MRNNQICSVLLFSLYLERKRCFQSMSIDEFLHKFSIFNLAHERYHFLLILDRTTCKTYEKNIVNHDVGNISPSWTEDEIYRYN